jgi:RNA 3'-terminal phosphate cyclase (ATP)
VVLVDGSFGEGGGQIIRNAVTLTILLRKKVEVIRIRAGRPNPGLASQHLESILAMLRLTGATTTRTLQKGSTEFDIDARAVRLGSEGVNTTIDLKTAGSITLSIQCLLPYLLSLKAASQLELIGGTHVMKAPNVDYMDRVFLPILTKSLGYSLDLKMTRPGYFPRGGGRVQLRTNPTPTFNPFIINQRGRLLEKSAILNLVSSVDPKPIIERLSFFGREDRNNITVNNVTYNSVEYFLRFENSCAGFYYLLPGRPGAAPTMNEIWRAVEKVEAETCQFMESPSAALDWFMQDQLIIYMTLAKLSNPNQVSQFTTLGPLTDHTMSAIHVAENFTRLKFTIETEKHVRGETCLISL